MLFSYRLTGEKTILESSLLYVYNKLVPMTSHIYILSLNPPSHDTLVKMFRLSKCVQQVSYDYLRRVWCSPGANVGSAGVRYRW